VVVGLHSTWLVNSATHMWGRRRFATTDDSRNTWWVALLTFGEGWHNNHHAHPTSARHGLAWYELDVTWLELKLLRALGLVWDVRVANVSDASEDWVSMNCWACPAKTMTLFQPLFVDFLAQQAGSPGAECALPETIGTLVSRGRARVRVIRAGHGWLGVTHASDQMFVSERLRALGPPNHITD
jgi:hypothetical protein